MSKPPAVQRFGEKLRLLRIKHGLSMQAVADALGTSSGYISNVEHGKKKPGIDFAMQVARFFNVSTDQLMRDELEVQ